MDVSHGFHVFMDGNAWCAVGPHFIDLMQSTAGFGETPEQAVEALRAEWLKEPWWRDKALPKFEKFTVHPPPPPSSPRHPRRRRERTMSDIMTELNAERHGTRFVLSIELHTEQAAADFLAGFRQRFAKNGKVTLELNATATTVVTTYD